MTRRGDLKRTGQEGGKKMPMTSTCERGKDLQKPDRDRTHFRNFEKRKLGPDQLVSYPGSNIIGPEFGGKKKTESSRMVTTLVERTSSRRRKVNWNRVVVKEKMKQGNVELKGIRRSCTAQGRNGHERGLKQKGGGEGGDDSTLCARGAEGAVREKLLDH